MRAVDAVMARGTTLGVLISRWTRRFDARVTRERILIIAAVLAATAWLGDKAFITPAYQRWKAQHELATMTEAAVRQVRQDQVDQIAQARATEQQLRQDVARWRQRAQQEDGDLRALGADLVPADQMVDVLHGVLQQTGGLRVRRMQTLPRTEPGAAGAQSSAGTPLYRHGVELEVEGSYASLLAYCQALESLPRHVLWGGMQLKADQHPHLVLTLRLYTLSADRQWMVL
jgi:MSHA biogenesis protein MshJ